MTDWDRVVREAMTDWDRVVREAQAAKALKRKTELPVRHLTLLEQALIVATIGWLVEKQGHVFSAYGFYAWAVLLVVLLAKDLHSFWKGLRA